MTSTGVKSWSKTAATNATADTNVNWSEGQNASTVNDSARAMMASVAFYRDDIAGGIATGGTSSAYTLTTNQVFQTLTECVGQVVAFQPHADCASTVTLNVDSLGAMPLRSAPNTELTAGQLKAGRPTRATYFSSNGGEWISHSVPLSAIGYTGKYDDIIAGYKLGENFRYDSGGIDSSGWAAISKIFDQGGIGWNITSTGHIGYIGFYGAVGGDTFYIKTANNTSLNGSATPTTLLQISSAGCTINGSSVITQSFLNANAVSSASTATTVGGWSPPASSTLPVGSYALMYNNSGTSVPNGNGIAGSSLTTFTGSGAGATQTGTWVNISGVTVNNTSTGLFVRQA
jgi:hypothetical protein